jgi:hypothetical protein
MLRLLFTWLALALSVDAVARTRPPSDAKVVAPTSSQYTSVRAIEMKRVKSDSNGD